MGWTVMAFGTHTAVWMQGRGQRKFIRSTPRVLLHAGTDEKAIINLLTKRSNYQRQIITDSYQALYNKVNKEKRKEKCPVHMQSVGEKNIPKPHGHAQNGAHCLSQ